MQVYQIITDRVISLLEAGTVPWHKPWVGGGAPANLSSGKHYRGINVFMLGAAGYDSPWWVSYKQAQQRGGHVKKGEKGFPCVFWKWPDRKKQDDDTEEHAKRRGPILRYYSVFNVRQCEGSPAMRITTNVQTPMSEKN